MPSNAYKILGFDIILLNFKANLMFSLFLTHIPKNEQNKIFSRFQCSSRNFAMFHARSGNSLQIWKYYLFILQIIFYTKLSTLVQSCVLALNPLQHLPLELLPNIKGS